MGEWRWDSVLWLPDNGGMGFNLRYLGALVLNGAFALAIAHVATRLFDGPSVRLARWVAGVMGLTASKKGKMREKGG